MKENLRKQLMNQMSAEPDPDRKNHLPRHFFMEAGLILAALVFLYPIILIFYNSLKTYSQIMTNVVTFPKGLEFGNYSHAWHLMQYPKVFFNTLCVTVGGVLGIVFFGSMAAYKLSRTTTRFSWLLLALCIAPMMIPFQTIMIPMMQVAKNLRLSNSLWGLAVMYWGFGVPFVIFLYHGFIKTIPREMDECASIDGCSTFRTFFNIIFPQLKSITVTIIVLDVMWIWNDFLLPLLMVNSSQTIKTLQLAAYTFFGQYISEWHYALAGLVMAVTPSVLFFMIMQKHIIKGVTAGAVKG